MARKFKTYLVSTGTEHLLHTDDLQTAKQAADRADFAQVIRTADLQILHTKRSSKPKLSKEAYRDLMCRAIAARAL